MKNAISQREIQLLEELIPERVSDEWRHNQELCMEVCTGYEESDCSEYLGGYIPGPEEQTKLFK